MKIEVKQVAPDVYSLTFDDTTVALEGNEIKTLLLQVTKVLSPGAVKKTKEETYADFLKRLKNANNVGLQGLLRAADHDDMVVLLKYGEGDALFHKRLFGNMSDNAAKIFREDLSYQFKDGLPSSRLEEAMKRVMQAAARLEDDGLIVYENVKARG